MPEAFHEPDESFDDEPTPLLPPEDRIWRHPSEIHLHAGHPIAADVSAARERWLSRTPTRAGAWSAGLVGAVLATGVVLVGTHLTVWLGRSSPAAGSGINAVTTTVMRGDTAHVMAPDVNGLSAKVAAGLTVVQATTPRGAVVTGNGVVMASDGKILVPWSLVDGASAIQVTTLDGAVYAGRIVGSDETTQLAVLAIGVSAGAGFVPLAPSPKTSIEPGDWMAVEWSGLSGGKDNSVLSIGSVTSSSTFSSSKGTVQLLDTLNLRALDVNKAPVGTVLVNGSAQLLGIVTGRKGNQVVEIPASLAEQVGQQLVEHGRLTHGWLGIEGQGTVAPPLQTTNVRSGTSTKPTPGPAAGVKVLSVGSRSSAAQAGLRAGDVIEAIDGQAVASMQALQRALYVLPPRTYVSLTVERGTSVNTFYTLLQPAA